MKEVLEQIKIIKIRLSGIKSAGERFAIEGFELTPLYTLLGKLVAEKELDNVIEIKNKEQK
jgi:hypothetical protein